MIVNTGLYDIHGHAICRLDVINFGRNVRRTGRVVYNPRLAAFTVDTSEFEENKVKTIIFLYDVVETAEVIKDGPEFDIPMFALQHELEEEKKDSDMSKTTNLIKSHSGIGINRPIMCECGRKAFGLSLRDVAKAFDVAPNTIRNVENDVLEDMRHYRAINLDKYEEYLMEYTNYILDTNPLSEVWACFLPWVLYIEKTLTIPSASPILSRVYKKYEKNKKKSLVDFDLENDISLCRFLKAYRLVFDMSMSECAERTGLSKNMIVHIENQSYKNYIPRMQNRDRERLVKTLKEFDECIASGESFIVLYALSEGEAVAFDSATRILKRDLYFMKEYGTYPTTFSRELFWKLGYMTKEAYHE